MRRGRSAGAVLAVDEEINLRGQTVVEALAILDRFLRDAARKGHDRVKVIHGKGTRSPGGHSVVREAVRAHLENAITRGRIRDYRGGNVGEGGSGVTIVWL
ncbi:Smr/MutS family protein [Gemmatimonadota bacterium]